MLNRKILILLMALPLFQYCVSLAPVEQRQVRNVIDTKIKKDQAYDRALVWFAKSLTNANWAVQIKDKENGRIVANMTMQCPALAGAAELGMNEHTVSFTADFQAKDNKYRLTLEQITWNAKASNGVLHLRGPENEDDTKNIDVNCLKALRNDLHESVTQAKKADDNF